MPKGRNNSSDRLSRDVNRYAEFYFDPVEIARMLEETGCPPDADYAVLVQNRFVPIDCIPDSVRVPQKFVNGGQLDAAEIDTLKECWRELDASAAALSALFEAGEATARVKAAARGRQTWPAVAVAESEAEMRTLLMTQDEVMGRRSIPWRCADSSTYPRPKPDGIYVSVDWFWHGA